MHDCAEIEFDPPDQSADMNMDDKHALAERTLQTVAATFRAKVTRAPRGTDAGKWHVEFSDGHKHLVYMDDEGTLRSLVIIAKRKASWVLMDTPERVRAWFERVCPKP